MARRTRKHRALGGSVVAIAARPGRLYGQLRRDQRRLQKLLVDADEVVRLDAAARDDPTGKTKNARGIAEERLVKWAIDVENASPAGEGIRDVTVRDFAREYLKTRKAEVGDAHYKDLDKRIDRFVKFAGNRKMAHVTTADAETYLTKLAALKGRGCLLPVREKDGTWTPYAIELNLRKGGTTHPFLSLQFLTDGAYDPDTAVFTAPSGQEKCLVASDHVVNPAYRRLTPDDLFDIVARHSLHFDQTRQTGVVLHMMSALGDCGLVGMTAIGNSHDDAGAVYERAVAALDSEA